MGKMLSRRELISAGIAFGTLFLSVRSSSPFGANERIGLGFIGTGGMGRGLMRVAMANKDVDVVAVCDVREENLAMAMKMTDEKATPYKDFRQLLERKDIDAVFIATPDHWHCIQTIAACEAGKDVYVEKPLSHNIAEGRAAVNAAKRFNRVTQHGTQQLSGAHYAAAKELINKGAIGKITRVRVWNVWNETPNGIGNPPDEDPPKGLDWDMWLGPAPYRKFNRNRCYAPGYWFMWDYSGGFMLAWAIHHIDTVHWILNVTAPKAVMSVGGKYALNDNRETPDTQDALIDYGDFYVQASVYHTNSRPIEGRGYGIAFYGTNGTLVLTREGFELIPEPGRAEPVKQGGSPLHEPHVRNFLDCVKSRQRTVAPIEFGHTSTIPLHLANIAFKVGRVVRWDAERELIIGDEEANRHICRTYRRPWGEYVERYLSPHHRPYFRME
jgi:predicted dehydrogenase